MDKAIAWVLGLPTERSRATAYRAIREEITPRVGEAKPLPVLVIDEAQHLRNDVLEDLRLLTHFAIDSDNRLCLLLVGLTEMRRRLAIACHESLAQRLVVRHPLAGIDRCELDHSLAHRLRLARCELPLFEPPAIEALAHSTRGLPRLINRTAEGGGALGMLAGEQGVPYPALRLVLDHHQPQALDIAHLGRHIDRGGHGRIEAPGRGPMPMGAGCGQRNPSLRLQHLKRLQAPGELRRPTGINEPELRADFAPEGGAALARTLPVPQCDRGAPGPRAHAGSGGSVSGAAWPRITHERASFVQPHLWVQGSARGRGA